MMLLIKLERININYILCKIYIKNVWTIYILLLFFLV